MSDSRVHDDLERLAAIVASSDDAIISKTLDGIITTWNKGAENILGFAADEMIGKPIFTIIPPELHDEEAQILARLRSGQKIEHFETVRLAKDGRRIDLSLTVSPLRDRHGMIVGASKVARDIGERRRADELRQILVDELNHRVKNTLALVQSIASQSLRTAPDPAAFVTAFNSRIEAMAQTHDLLMRENLVGVNLRDLVIQQVVPDADDAGRICIDGPELVVGGAAGSHLGLVTHELATNARKYGALSTAAGTVHIHWHLEQDGDTPCLVLHWRESGVGAAPPVPRVGFGTTLLRRVVSALEGSLAIEDSAAGREILMNLPLEHYRLASNPEGDSKEDSGPMPAARPGLEGQRVLIVEDEFIIAMDIETAVLQEGCVVVALATSVEQALVQIASHPLDLAILDANLHGKSVERVAEALDDKGVPFLFATGYGIDSLPVGWKARPVLGKPFTAAQLAQALSALLPQE